MALNAETMTQTALDKLGDAGFDVGVENEKSFSRQFVAAICEAVVEHIHSDAKALTKTDGAVPIE